MLAQITSLAGRAQSGISKPFLCGTTDGNAWFVKRDNIGWESLVTEYVVSSLAEAFGLPVAPFKLLEIPQLLTKQAIVSDGYEFQPGAAFASRRVPFAEDLRQSHLIHIAEEEKIRCFCFDWWTQNNSRKLDILGGDPNLLWDPVMQNLALIDHTRALDDGFEEEMFFNEHPFRDIRPFIERAQLEKLRTSFESAVYGLDKIWEEIPEEWLTDPAGESRISLTFHDIEAKLMKPKLAIDGLLPV